MTKPLILALLLTTLHVDLGRAADATEEPAVPPVPGVECPAAVAARDSVLVLGTEGDFRGTGFIVGDGRTVMTAFHVVDEDEVRFARDRRGRSYRLRLVAVDRRHDLAVMQIEGGPADAPAPLHIREGQVGERVFAIGHGFGRSTSDASLFRWSLLSGALASTDGVFVLLDVGAAPGASGGPMVGCDGRVVGITSWGRPGYTYTNGAAARPLQELLSRRADIPGERDEPRVLARLDVGVVAMDGVDEAGAQLGLTWKLGRTLGLRLTSSLSTNTAFGDFLVEGQRRTTRVPMSLLAEWPLGWGGIESLSVGAGIGWERRQLTELVLGPEGGLATRSSTDDDLIVNAYVSVLIGVVTIGVELDARATDGWHVSPLVILGFHTALGTTGAGGL